MLTNNGPRMKLGYDTFLLITMIIVLISRKEYNEKCNDQ